MSEDALWEDSGSIFRPSYSATWLNCLGSLQASRHESDTAGIHAAVGTVFHSLMAEWQTNGRPDQWLGRIETIITEDLSQQFDVEVDEEMFYYGEVCLKYYADLPGDRYVEIRVDISDITPIPNQKGTADLVICRVRVLIIVDWKYGKGVQVFAQENTQELLYAWGVFLKYDPIYHFEEIELHIAQPRLNHFDVWKISREELIAWADWMRERAHAAWRPGAPRTAGPKQCQWCKVRGCVAQAIALDNLVDMSFDAIEEPVTESDMKTAVALGSPLKKLPDPGTLPTENLSKIVSYQKMFESFFKRAREELTNRYLDGEQTELWKLVEARTRRRYRNENHAAEKLSLLLSEEDLFQRTIASPAQVEKLLRMAGVRGKLLTAYMNILVVKPPGKPTLAPDGDNRFAIPDPTDVFEADDDIDEAAL